MSNFLSDGLIFFAKFDYALSRSGFYKNGRALNRTTDTKAIESDWDEFLKHLPDVFYTQIKNNPCFSKIFEDGGPKVWGIKDAEKPRFHVDCQISDTKTLLYACKHIRNNLIHGEKFQQDKVDIQRNRDLLACAEGILIEAMKAVKGADDCIVFDRFQDIPNS